MDMEDFNFNIYQKKESYQPSYPFETTPAQNIRNLNKQEKTTKGIYEWTQYFRKYPADLAELWGIHLYPFQKFILTMWFRNNYGMYLAARGQGKTFLIAVFCLLKMTLYPNTKIVVCSGVKSQALKIVTEKIPEIVEKRELILKEFAFYPCKTSFSTPAPNVVFKNGSTLTVVAANDNARSCRANVLILDEFRQIKKDVYDAILRKFLAPERKLGYRHKEEWKDYPMERNQEFFLTSCYYKFNWWYEKYQVFLSQMVKGRKYSLVAFPYQMSIKHKLLNPDALKDEFEESDFNPFTFQMEMQCMPYGQSDKAYFSAEEMDLLRTLNYPIYPMEYYTPSVIDDKKFRPDNKRNGEIRLLCCDIATMSGKVNDASAYLLLRLLPDKKGYMRQVPYICTIEGGHTLTQAVMIKRLYKSLDCDYIVLDRQNAGIGVYDNLVLPTYDSETNETYEPMCSCNDEEMIKRCPYDDAIKVIYTIAASEAFNDEIARDLKDVIRRRRLELLGDKDSMNDYFDHFPNYYSKTSSDIKKILATTYEETESLINEMVLLEYTLGNSANEYIRLRTTSRNRKDRYTALAYGNNIAKILEQKLLVPDDNSSMADMIRLINGNKNNTNLNKSNNKGLGIKLY